MTALFAEGGIRARIDEAVGILQAATARIAEDRL